MHQGHAGAADGVVRVAGFLAGGGRAPAAGADVQGAPPLGRRRGALPPRPSSPPPGRDLHAAGAELPRRASARGPRLEEGRSGRLRAPPEGAPAVLCLKGGRVPTAR